jgi:putative CocE/NonD family hydrolase
MKPSLFRQIAVAAALMVTVAAGGEKEREPVREAFPGDDFALDEAMIAMRDGVELYTLILTPKNASGPLPILLTRTPYDASETLTRRPSTRLEVLCGTRFVGGGYIHVVQDLRGRFRSQGDYAMYRAPRGPFNRSETDETTDAWDTIDWLVKNVSGHNGKVGVWGTSYPGWLTLAALREPHPALAAAVPFNPVVDVWKADDWFHWGAFRAAYAFDFIYMMETRRGSNSAYPYETRDRYTWMLNRGSAEQGLGSLLDQRHEMWSWLMKYPSYGPYWREVAADQWFDKLDRLVPTLHVHGLWDQEDIYGSPQVYAALEKHDSKNDANFLAVGPWFHGQHFGDGSTLGPLDFDEDTAKRFRETILSPFLDRFLKGQDVRLPAQVTAFETGSNRWRQFDQWPAAQGKRTLYLRADGRLSFTAPTEGTSMSEYISDPAKPVPNAPRPHLGFDYNNAESLDAWRRWLVEDQRFVDGRPDVATWSSEPLEESVTIRGPVAARLFAETTGTDADWVVKLIDVFPDEDPESIERSGMQIMISADIFRGRYRESFEVPKPLVPNEVLEYTIPLPHANHTFLKGHRLMVQIQSTWFPVYDRNPQTFVPSIMSASRDAYKAQRHRVHHSVRHPTHLELMVDSD